jgi:hypothetical protein
LIDGFKMQFFKIKLPERAVRLLGVTRLLLAILVPVTCKKFSSILFVLLQSTIAFVGFLSGIFSPDRDDF